MALVDPVGLDRHSRWRYGYWAFRAIWMRPLFRALVRLAGRLRLPVLRVLEAVRPTERPNDHTLSEDQFRQLAEEAVSDRSHLLSLAALLEPNIGLPFGLAEGDFSGISPDRYLGVLQSRVASLTPDVHPESIERIAVQYELQVRTQNAYVLSPYDGEVLLVEPISRYVGLVSALLHPYVRNMRLRAVALGPRSERTQGLSERFGRLEWHYRSMRDDRFVQGLVRELNSMLE